MDRVSRFLLHINDVNVPKYGAACCVSLRSNRALSRSRDLDSLRTPAGAPAAAPRVSFACRNSITVWFLARAWISKKSG